MDRIKLMVDTETGGLPSLTPKEFVRFMGWSANGEPIFSREECNPVDYSDIGLTQIAAVPFQLSPEAYEPQIMGPSLSIRLQPVPGLLYDPEALAINGDTLEGLLETGVAEYEAYFLFVEYLKTYLGPDQIWWTGEIFAHNAEFDTGMLCAFERRVLDFNLTNAVLHYKGHPARNMMGCTRLMWTNLKGLEYHSHPMASLSYIAKIAGIEKPQEHLAEADCLLGIQVLSFMRKMMQGTESGYSRKPKDMFKHYQTGAIVVYAGEATMGGEKYAITYPIGERSKQTIELHSIFHGKEAGDGGKPVRRWQKLKGEALVTDAPAEISE